MPSGLYCGDNSGNNPDGIVRARHTLTFQQPKLSFFFAENAVFTGEWEALDIGLSSEAIEKQDSNYFMLHKKDIAGYIQPRRKFAHKGDFGHACLIAGSRGMMGACVLATKACMRAGAGGVMAHVPQSGNIIIQTSAPEALASLDADFEAFTGLPDLNVCSAVGVGPGIGKRPETQQALLALLRAVNAAGSRLPSVFDADALNILSENPKWLKLLPPNSILTPHPKEFDRMAGSSENGYRRHLKQMEMARQYSVFIALKGAYTSIATPDGRCFFNATGNPGMATAGSGDVLTGIIVSLLAQGWPPQRAVCGGVWLHGAAGDKAALKSGWQALIASDIIENIGNVFNELQKNE
jgi:NAD(P)H-hydrate epimerase